MVTLTKFAATKALKMYLWRYLKAMKSKWLLLTKIQLMGMLDFNKSRYAKDAKLTRRTAGSFAIIAIIALVICVYSVIISIGFCEQGIGRTSRHF